MSIWICPIYQGSTVLIKSRYHYYFAHTFVYIPIFSFILFIEKKEMKIGKDWMRMADDKQRKTYRRVTVIMPEPNKERDDKIIQDVIDIIAKDIARKCRKMI